MAGRATKRFVFIGGIPVFDYMITVRMEEIARVVGSNVFVVGTRLLLPVGTVFALRVEGSAEPAYVNPMANAELQNLHDRPYYGLEFGGKHPEQFGFTLRGDLDTILGELRERYPELIRGPEDLKVVEVGETVQVLLGGNNKNIIEAIKTLYASPELAAEAEGICFEHHFFFDTTNPKFRLVRELYGRLGVSMGGPEDMHVDGLLPRIGYVFTVVGDDGKPLDRVILSNKVNEQIIPSDRLSERYFQLEYHLRRDEEFVETHLVINSMTNEEEIRLLVRLLKTAHASGVRVYLCPTLTLLKGIDRLIENKYYTVEKERFFQYRRDFMYTAVLPYVRCMILNREELSLVDNTVMKKGIDATATYLAHRMNQGRREDGAQGGKLVVTGGSSGARYTEKLPPERAVKFWRKARLGEDKGVRFAERRIVCGDDYLPNLVTTLGAGDCFTGIFIGLTALRWDGGHALRAASLGAQHFIQHRTRPAVSDIVAMDEWHIRLGTETELVDVVAHHVAETGDPTRYGTITDTVITVTTTQVQHPFREVLQLARRIAGTKAAGGAGA